MQGALWFEPTVITEVASDMRIARQEIVGPIAALTRFDNEAESIRMANDSESGLAAYCYTRDAARKWRLAEVLETGMVGVNTGIISTEVAPFGDIKQAGVGREGSRHGLVDYLELKYVALVS